MIMAGHRRSKLMRAAISVGSSLLVLTASDEMGPSPLSGGVGKPRLRKESLLGKAPARRSDRFRAGTQRFATGD